MSQLPLDAVDRDGAVRDAAAVAGEDPRAAFVARADCSAEARSPVRRCWA